MLRINHWTMKFLKSMLLIVSSPHSRRVAISYSLWFERTDKDLWHLVIQSVSQSGESGEWRLVVVRLVDR